MRLITRLVVATLIGIAVTPLLMPPARACSCVMPPDIAAWVDESQAAFVGTLIQKQDAGGGQFGPESIYVFEVEEWVKGDAGDVIEVHSASDGSACGFEFWDPDQRIGAIIREEGGVLRGDLCSQVEPDVLLAATKTPTPSATGIGHLLIGGGWGSSHLTVVDDIGHHVIGLDPPDIDPATGGSTMLDVCPGGRLAVQSTPSSVVVWDLASYETVTSHPVPGGWISDISCRTEDASSVWVIAGDDVHSELSEVVGEPEVLQSLPGPIGQIGSDFVVAQKTHEGDAIWIDLETGAATELTSTPPDELRSVSVATHPTEPLVAVVQTRFAEGGPVTASLTIFDPTGAAVQTLDIPWETYAPVWLDENRVAVRAYDNADWENARGLIYDLGTGDSLEIEGWTMDNTIADGDTLYGISGGSIMTTSLTNPEIENLVTLPTQSAGPLVLLDEAPAVAPPTTLADASGNTTPPLIAGGQDDSGGVASHIQWLAGATIVTFFGVLLWLARRPRTESPDD